MRVRYARTASLGPATEHDNVRAGIVHPNAIRGDGGVPGERCALLEAAGRNGCQMIRNVIALSTARVRSRVPSLSRMVET